MADDTHTLHLSAAQHRLLRDLVHWAATDVPHGDRPTRYQFWADIVADWDREADVATMQEIEAILNPPQSLTGGKPRGRPGTP